MSVNFQAKVRVKLGVTMYSGKYCQILSRDFESMAAMDTSKGKLFTSPPCRPTLTKEWIRYFMG